MYPPSHLEKKKEEQHNEPQAQHRLVPKWAGGGEGTVLNTAPLAWAMAASDNAESHGKAKQEDKRSKKSSKCLKIATKTDSEYL